MYDIKKYVRLNIVAHISFWLGSMILMLFFFYYNEDKVHIDLSILTKAFIINLGFAAAVYINLYLLIPRFLKQKNYVFYVFWLVVLLSVTGAFIQFLLIFPLRNVLDPGGRLSSFDPDLHAAYFFATLIYVAFTSFIKFIKEWLTMQDINLRLAKIEQQKLEAELKTLKGQLNPHFLFNSLNNIYSLSLLNSGKVPRLILTLADLMRHIIYESREKYIALEKEIEFVNNFIEMQRIRTSGDVEIKYEIHGQVPSAQIAPLLFEPFIDNAFKHGLPGVTGKDYIHISFDFIKPDWLSFTISNNYEIPVNPIKKEGGIGLSNVQQRLQYLYQPSDYQLQISNQNNVHSVHLLLKLK
jgi:two-component system, LytTR family, sensor kinase